MPKHAEDLLTSVEDTATGLQQFDSRKEHQSFSVQSRPHRLCSPANSLHNENGRRGGRRSSTRDKATQREADPAPHPSTKIQNLWKI